MTTVWAWKKIKELDGKTGFVPVDEKIAKKLIATGKVQDPKVGGKFLKHIDDTPIKKAAAKAPVKAPVKTPAKAKDESPTKG